MKKITAARKGLKGQVTVPGDKSISHRALILGALAEGITEIENFLVAQDTLATLNCLEKYGVRIERRETFVRVFGTAQNFSEPQDILDAQNSGTTLRLLSGVAATFPFVSVFTGDASLRRRPMKRVLEPLTQMGARVLARGQGDYAPFAIKGGKLRGQDFILKKASAQVKSALLLAGLRAEGNTSVTEPQLSRDHTERMLVGFGAKIKREGLRVEISGGQKLSGQKVVVPGDFSTASFFIVAALIVPDSHLIIKNVGLNPTRTGLLTVLKEMGANIQILNFHENSGEPVGDLEVKYSPLKAVEVPPEIVPAMIDEFPILAVAMALAYGESKVRGAEELRVKESDRIKSIVSEFSKMGVAVKELPDGFIISGGNKILGTTVDSHHDHRIAMSLAVLGLTAAGTTEILNADAVAISYPEFFQQLTKLTEGA
ncbi:3-phosphoshikimate 1-carboxyvinyltransferase [Carboxydothermus ferrireducens]|uniref:3-phosphoshikimate 1-carboxyvinyltransferase n=1 Tax=Carboxydothermus ferrireducens DSM 11255 TaxID=1119529 RepID=A0ABX2RDF8_9THEO|nr:3-phosphoshikimate 1-carboxyvinyltransferase [Carboxydothermus ferrireducens]NYE58642.1 3-phosphoshikimate 1-carboxyvinyltransferase [Carboxydothermus ferrireducens DSM 11255]